MEKLNFPQLLWLADWLERARRQLPWHVEWSPHYELGNWEKAEVLACAHEEGGRFRSEVSTLVRGYARMGRWPKKMKPKQQFWLAAWLEAGMSAALAEAPKHSPSPTPAAFLPPTGGPETITEFLSASWDGAFGYAWCEENEERLIAGLREY